MIKRRFRAGADAHRAMVMHATGVVSCIRAIAVV